MNRTLEHWMFLSVLSLIAAITLYQGITNKPDAGYWAGGLALATAIVIDSKEE